MERSNLQRSRNRSIPKVKIKQRRINDRYRHTTHKTTGDWLKINSTKPNGKKLTQKITKTRAIFHSVRLNSNPI